MTIYNPLRLDKNGSITPRVSLPASIYNPLRLDKNKALEMRKKF